MIISSDFTTQAIQLFENQYQKNHVYRLYCQLLRVNPNEIDRLEKIPFLPVSFFKNHRVVTGDFVPEKRFLSSTTTGDTHSVHEIRSLAFYEDNCLDCFSSFYGHPSDYTFLALLPSYLERRDSSLIYMMNKFITVSGKKESGFFLYNHEELYHTLIQLQANKQKTILFGVTYALLDFIENYTLDFPELLVFETGGMKGRRQEMVKEQVHHLLMKAFNVDEIHSEYGMCELFSQAYSKGNNLFETPPQMQFLLRDIKDPFDLSSSIESGVINIIDLANRDSCAFIATDDLGKKNGKGIEILGRLDHVPVRGCNLLLG
ncbi:MAG: acyltransferase [Bacteroidales bacterium]|jgi:hypothetical protein|nr:acyltransferase [Bacteroidales bacterium]